MRDGASKHCGKLQVLLNKYRACTEEYSASVMRLSRNLGTSSKAEFHAMLKESRPSP